MIIFLIVKVILCKCSLWNLSLKNEEIRNEYIEQGREIIEEVINDLDLDQCDDVELKQDGGLYQTFDW